LRNNFKTITVTENDVGTGSDIDSSILQCHPIGSQSEK
jgi:hypothetical protein